LSYREKKVKKLEDEINSKDIELHKKDMYIKELEDDLKSNQKSKNESASKLT
jgi:hypothetical protein